MKIRPVSAGAFMFCFALGSYYMVIGSYGQFAIQAILASVNFAFMFDNSN